MVSLMSGHDHFRICVILAHEDDESAICEVITRFAEVDAIQEARDLINKVSDPGSRALVQSEFALGLASVKHPSAKAAIDLASKRSSRVTGNPALSLEVTATIALARSLSGQRSAAELIDPFFAGLDVDPSHLPFQALARIAQSAYLSGLPAFVERTLSIFAVAERMIFAGDVDSMQFSNAAWFHCEVLYTIGKRLEARQALDSAVYSMNTIFGNAPSYYLIYSVFRLAFVALNFGDVASGCQIAGTALRMRGIYKLSEDPFDPFLHISSFLNTLSMVYAKAGNGDNAIEALHLADAFERNAHSNDQEQTPDWYRRASAAIDRFEVFYALGRLVDARTCLTWADLSFDRLFEERRKRGAGNNQAVYYDIDILSRIGAGWMKLQSTNRHPSR